MAETEKQTQVVDYKSVEMSILVKVKSRGLVEDIESWKKAFPDVEFPEKDDDFTGKEIKWTERTMEEKAFYVAYMNDPQAARVAYTLDVEDVKLYKEIDDSEKVWYMWMEGCFTGEQLDEKAIKTLLFYADESELARKYIADMDMEDVKLLSFLVKVAPF
jgi:hypothetical protein